MVRRNSLGASALANVDGAADDSRAPDERVQVEHRDPSLLEAEGAAAALGTQDAIDGRPGGAREAGDVLLGERDHRRLVAAAVAPGQLHQPAKDARLDRQVERLLQLHREREHTMREDVDQQVGERAVALSEMVEVAPVDDERLGRLERTNRRPPVALDGDERELTEDLVPLDDRGRLLAAVGTRHRHRQAAVQDDVEGVGRIALLVDDLPGVVGAPLRALDELPLLVGRQPLQEPRLAHELSLSDKWRVVTRAKCPQGGLEVPNRLRFRACRHTTWWWLAQVLSGWPARASCCAGGQVCDWRSSTRRRASVRTRPATTAA